MVLCVSLLLLASQCPVCAPNLVQPLDLKRRVGGMCFLYRLRSATVIPPLSSRRVPGPTAAPVFSGAQSYRWSSVAGPVSGVNPHCHLWSRNFPQSPLDCASRLLLPVSVSLWNPCDRKPGVWRCWRKSLLREAWVMNKLSGWWQCCPLGLCW